MNSVQQQSIGKEAFLLMSTALNRGVSPFFLCSVIKGFMLQTGDPLGALRCAVALLCLLSTLCYWHAALLPYYVHAAAAGNWLPGALHYCQAVCMLLLPPACRAAIKLPASPKHNQTFWSHLQATARAASRSGAESFPMRSAGNAAIVCLCPRLTALLVCEPPCPTA